MYIVYVLQTLSGLNKIIIFKIALYTSSRQEYIYFKIDLYKVRTTLEPEFNLFMIVIDPSI